MPMYDFRCTECEHVFEDLVPSDAPPPVCPQCGAASERQLSTPSLWIKKQSRKGKVFAEKHKARGTKSFK